ncbi:MAG: PTS sugar transporter subunit IIB [Solobacterium sp.]|jgi:PTS system ascorbate-specific IIB component|nr:PTS sugar transporter subunit IIB [Solobacterium sp.]MCH4048584.1 PTS sugar transporter subunit IIB [Solobacterium sp.]MCH4074565.1 PTS sugar transporter subunit IIB [Solobacterium sp.]MCI1314549.1 PTS sugar transporter subunit IIB [Solobacterium sp.]MCI1408356.1 PTS sugar transporter subunit IIB [Solobacterium sp.]
MASILACCANGSGTSLMMAMTLEKAIKAEGWNVTKTHHCSLSEGKNTAVNYDIVLCPQNFTNMFKDAEAKGVKVIGLRNVMSQKEMVEKINASGVNLK